MVAFEALPVVKPQLVLAWNNSRPSTVLSIGAPVKVPLPDVGGSVSAATKGVSDGPTVRIQLNIVDIDAVGQRVLACHKTGAIGTTYGTAGHRVGDIDAACR